MQRALTISILCFFTITIFAQTAPKPFVLGEIHELQSKVLNEKRILNIYLPEGYNKKDSIHYPVIYLFDGSADEDFIHIAGIVQYDNFEWVNRLPRSIVVGIATVNRRRDFTFPTTIASDQKLYPEAGHSAKFISFLETELQPYVNTQFKTTQSKTLIGESLGGLLATEILLKKPTLFNKYIIVSPSIWWDNGSLLNQSSDLMNEHFTEQTDIYIGVGKEGLTPTAIPRVMEVDANLLADKINATKSKTVRVIFDYLPEEDHATIMHQAVLNAFRKLNEFKK